MNLATYLQQMIEKYISFLKSLFLRMIKSYLKLAPTEIYYLNCIIEEYYTLGWRTVNWRVALPESPKKEKVKVYAQVNWQIDYVGQGREKKIY